MALYQAEVCLFASYGRCAGSAAMDRRLDNVIIMSNGVSSPCKAAAPSLRFRSIAEGDIHKTEHNSARVIWGFSFIRPSTCSVVMAPFCQFSEAPSPVVSALIIASFNYKNDTHEVEKAD